MMMDDEMDTMDEDAGDEVVAPAAGMDARKIRETLDQITALVSQLQSALPEAEDAGEEQADTVDDATDEAPTEDDDGGPQEDAGSGDKAMRKASAIAMIKKQLV